MPSVVSLYTVTGSSPEFSRTTSIMSSVRLNNMSGAVKAFSPLNRSFGSNAAANFIGGRFQSGMKAGTTTEWPEGMEIVS